MNQIVKILVVEDTVIAQLGVEALLEQIDCQYKIVDTGEEAVAIADQYDLILMDVGLPGISGIDAAAAIREKGVTAPIVALTAHDTNREKCLEAGMNNFINKPLTLQSLNEMVNMVVL